MYPDTAPSVIQQLPFCVWGRILQQVDCHDVGVLACASQFLHNVVQRRRTAINSARHHSRVQLRRLRSHMQCRRMFVAAAGAGMEDRQGSHTCIAESIRVGYNRQCEALSSSDSLLLCCAFE